jgi:hypothetical protein
MMGEWRRPSTREKRSRRCTILREAGLLDEFFVFLEEIGMMAVVERLELPGVQRVLVPTVQFVLLYLRHPCSLVASR